MDIEGSTTIKYLRVTIDQDLKWKSHTNDIRNKSMAALASVKRSSIFLPVATRKLLFNSRVRPHLDYCSVVWHSCNFSTSQRLERVQNYSMRVILGKPPRTPSSSLRQQLNWSTLYQRRHTHMLNQVHRCALNLAPSCTFALGIQLSTYTPTHEEPTTFTSSNLTLITIEVPSNTKERFTTTAYLWI